MKDKIINTIKNSSIFLLMFFVTILMFTAIMWIFKITIGKLYLPIEFLLTILIYGLIKYHKIENRTKTNIIMDVITILLAAVIFSVSTFFTTYVYDVTSDGNTYHKLAVGSMKNGWDPIYESSRDYTEEKGNVVTVLDDNVNYLWVDHYAIGTEMIGANIYAFTNHIESGKAFSLTMMYICFGIALEYLINDKKIKWYKALIISFVLVANPITITQIGTFYVDTTLAMALFISIIELVKITDSKLNKNEKANNNLEYFILGMSIAMCINAKFTGLAYEAVFCGSFFIYWMYLAWKLGKDTFVKALRNNIIFYIVVLIISLCVIGFSSYSMNMIKHGNPLYPLYGKDHVPNMVNQEIPKSVSCKSHIEQFLISIFSKGKNVSPAYSNGTSEPELKVPFTLSKDEIKNYTIPDIRMGGFGPLYSGIFIISAIVSVAMIVDFIKNKKFDKLTEFLIIAGLGLALVTLLDGSYWARYIPYIYIVPIINLLYLDKKNIKLSKVIFWILSLVLIVNSLLVLKVAMSSYISNSRYVRKNLKAFREYSYTQYADDIEIKLNIHSFQGVQYNLDDLGIRVKLNDNINTTRDGFLFSY